MQETGSNQRNDFISVTNPPYNKEGLGGDEMIRHIDSELQGLKDLALQMGGCVEKALEKTCQVILNGDTQAFDETHRHETRINDLQIRIDEECVNVLAKQAPVAKDLRLVIAITKINTDLERMGDQAVNITHSARRIHDAWPKVVLPKEIARMIDEVRSMVRLTLDAFARRDVEMSNQVLDQDDAVDELKDALIESMKKQMKSNSDQVEVGLAFIMIAKNLERMADHATNIAEEVIYLATGNDVRHGHSVSVNS